MKLLANLARLAGGCCEDKVMCREMVKTRLLMKKVCDRLRQLGSSHRDVDEIVTGTHVVPGIGMIICSGITENISSTISGDAAAIKPPVDWTSLL